MSDDATAFRVALIFWGRSPRVATQMQRSVATLGWYDAIPLGLAEFANSPEASAGQKTKQPATSFKARLIFWMVENCLLPSVLNRRKNGASIAVAENGRTNENQVFC
jgi:hypothetical protein